MRTLLAAILVTAMLPLPSLAKTAAVAQSFASFTFVPSLERRRANFDKIIAQYRQTSAAGADALQAITGKYDVAELLQRGMTPLGLRADNVADVYALWWVSNWQASRGIQDNPLRPQMMAVKKQAETAMRSTPAFAATDDAAKQEMVDSFLIQTLLVEVLMDGGKTNDEMLKFAAIAANKNASSIGLDLSAIELTATGFTGQAAVLKATPSLPAVARTGPKTAKTLVGSASSSGIAASGLVGMWRSDWVENQYRAFTGLTLVSLNNTLIFTRGGYFMYGVPEGAGFDDAGAQAVIARDPKVAGRYVVQPGKIVLNYADGHTDAVDAKRNGNSWTLNYDGKWMSSKLLFADGAVLSGVYSNESITNAGGGIFVVGDHDFSFAPDGRFARGSQVSMSAPVFSSRDNAQSDSGRYRIAGSALILDYADGRREVISLFQETKGAEIWLNDTMYRPAR